MSYPYVLWIAVFIVAPMIMILLYAFTKHENDTLIFSFTLENFVKFFTEKEYIGALLLSLRIALATTVMCILIGYPAAYIIAGLSERMQTMMILLLTLPMWINMLLKTYAWKYMLEGMGFDTELKIILVMVYDFLPYMIMQIHTSLSKLNRDLLTAAYDLGANRRVTFRRVVLPLSIPGVISGITLVFLPAVSSIVIPSMLGGGGYVMIGNLIELYFLKRGDWNVGAAISLIMALIIIASMRLTKRIDRNGQEE